MLRFLLDPRGRMGRLRYLFALFGLMLWTLLLTTLARWQPDFTTSGRILDALMDGRFGDYGAAMDRLAEGSPLIAGAVILVHGLATLSFLSLTARRLQDMGRPGVYAAVGLITGPAVLAFVLAVLPGDRDENAYGPVGAPGGTPGDPARV